MNYRICIPSLWKGREEMESLRLLGLFESLLKLEYSKPLKFCLWFQKWPEEEIIDFQSKYNHKFDITYQFETHQFKSMTELRTKFVDWVDEETMIFMDDDYTLPSSFDVSEFQSGIQKVQDIFEKYSEIGHISIDSKKLPDEIRFPRRLVTGIRAMRRSDLRDTIGVFKEFNELVKGVLVNEDLAMSLLIHSVTPKLNALVHFSCPIRTVGTRETSSFKGTIFGISKSKRLNDAYIVFMNEVSEFTLYNYKIIRFQERYPDQVDFEISFASEDYIHGSWSPEKSVYWDEYWRLREENLSKFDIIRTLQRKFYSDHNNGLENPNLV